MAAKKHRYFITAGEARVAGKRSLHMTKRDRRAKGLTPFIFLLVLVLFLSFILLNGKKTVFALEQESILSQQFGKNRKNPPQKPESPHKLREQQKTGISIELLYQKERFLYTDKKIEPSNHLIAEEIYTYKINGTYAEKRVVMNRCLSAGSTFKTAVLYTMPRLKPLVEKAIKAVNTAPTDSQIQFSPEKRPMFLITREKSGLCVNEERLYTDIYWALMASPEAKVIIRPESVAAKITTTDNVKLTGLRANYSTDYAYSNDNRKHNIQLALKKINGYVLAPNQEFSFNKTVGRRTEVNGFLEAKIIVAGKYENGIGGGVCQASTTVYNAALLAGLTITSAKNHSLECAYELPSFDCMVNGSYADLKFKNETGRPVFIRSYGTDKSAVVEIYGQQLEYTIKRKSEIISRKEPPPPELEIDTEYKYHDPQAESGTQKTVSISHGELKSTGFLLYYDKKGCLIKREKIREDTYKAMKGLIAIAP